MTVKKATSAVLDELQKLGYGRELLSVYRGPTFAHVGLEDKESGADFLILAQGSRWTLHGYYLKCFRPGERRAHYMAQWPLTKEGTVECAKMFRRMVLLAKRQASKRFTDFADELRVSMDESVARLVR